jgi:hypothetical protein
MESLPGLAPPLLICNEDHHFNCCAEAKGYVAEQMRQIGVDPAGILLEPIGPGRRSAAAGARGRPRDPGCGGFPDSDRGRHGSGGSRSTGDLRARADRPLCREAGSDHCRGVSGSNPGKIPVEMIEVQSGPYLGEDDIVRFEDRYFPTDERIIKLQVLA